VRPGIEHRGRVFWIAYGAGTALMAWGLWLLVQATATGGERFGFAVWVVLADLLVDWLVVPVIACSGWLVTRVTPDWMRAPAQVGLVLSGTVLLVAWLPLRDTAAGTGNPTIQPLDYPVAVAVTIAVIGSAMALWAARRWRLVRG
jgi:hypothetical protein